jgi:collagenase-like PrtC family protease
MMMELSVPTNWDDRLLEWIFGHDTAGRITEIYGKLLFDEIGGGRPAFPLAFVSRRAAKRHIQKIRGLGIRFNYLLNGLCMDNREFTRAGQKRLNSLLEWIISAGTDKVTVANPYLFMMIRKRYPDLAVSVSALAGVDSVSRARFWESLGADTITFPGGSVNRDFALIKQLRKALRCRIQLIANNCCMLDCPFYTIHGMANAHASQSWHQCKGFFLDYYVIRCRLFRLLDPVRFLRSDWIRPEDTGIYESMGVDSFKLTDRRLPTAILVKSIGAYLNRKYEGDLMEFFSMFQGSSCFEHRGLFRKLLAFIPQLPGAISARKFADCFAKLQVRIDNRSLDGFIEGLPAGCTGRDCSGCDYCHKAAQRALSIDEKYRAGLCRRYQDVLAQLSQRGLG